MYQQSLINYDKCTMPIQDIIYGQIGYEVMRALCTIFTIFLQFKTVLK